MQPSSPLRLPTHTDIVVVGNGPAGILLSLLLSGYQPYYNADPSRSHPDPILHRMLAPSSLSGSRPRSLLKQDFVQLTRHIQHQLAEAGRDANPISAMFDTLAHPLLDTHRGEYPSFLEWQHPANNRSLDSPDSPPPTPVLKHITTTSLPSSGTDTTGVGGGGGVPRTSKGMSRPHIVLGRGDIGGIWADMEHDHNQTLSYQEHMELPLYSFADFVREHPEIGDENLERPLRSTVSAYYKEYVRYIGIQSNFSNNTVVTGIYHLKDLENHCCCSMDPRHRQNCGGKRHGGVAQPSASESSDESVGGSKPRVASVATACRSCAAFRYAVMGYIESTTTPNDTSDSEPGQVSSPARRRTRFLIRCKTIVLATGTFDQPKKLPAVSIHPCCPPPSATIQQTFHDTRQLEEWMVRHGVQTTATASLPSAHVSLDTASLPQSLNVSTPSSQSLSSSTVAPGTASSLTPSSAPSPLSSLALSNNITTPSSSLPIVIVGTGLSAADAILLIQEKQPWRRVIHIYKHFSSTEPSPLKRCHRDVYPEYASVWVRMKKFATLKNSIHSQPAIRKDAGCNSAGHVSFHSVFGEGADSDNVQSVKPSCVQCEEKQQAMTLGEYDAAVGALPLCSACAYRGLPDASVSSWNPVTREIVIIMNHGAVIKERVAAVGVFIGKQVHMGFLKGSLATEMFATGDSVPRADPVASMRGRTGRTRKTGRGHVRDSSGDLPVNIPTPPCTPPRSPALRPRGQSTWQKQVSKPKGDGSDSVRSFGPTSAPTSSSQVPVGDEGARTEVQVQQDSGVDANSCLPEPKDDEETRHGESADFGDQGDSEGTEPEDDVDESQVLTLLHPLVSDMYNFRIIPMGKVEDVPAPVSISSSTSSLPMETSPTYPMKPKRCTRLPCYPIRQTNTVSNPAPITPAPSTAASCSPSPSSSTCESDSDDNKVTMQVESLFLVNDSKHQGSGSGSSVMKAMSMSCISMPCSPLLGCRIVSTDLPSPPLLTLYSAAASAVASSMAALLPASVSCPISPSESPESLSEASSTALSPSSSTSSLVLLEDEAKNIPSTTLQDTKCCSLTLPALKTCTRIRTTDIVATAEERQATAADKEEEDEEEEIAPLMDQSIYAAGAITGSKFVRYVLGNGIAIVADILKREVSRNGVLID